MRNLENKPILKKAITANRTLAKLSVLEDFRARQNFLNEPKEIKKLSQIIDSTLLKREASHDEFLKLFLDANEYGFKSVCVPPYYVPLAKQNCKNVLVCTVIGFPNGYNTIQNKIKETHDAMDLGANEIDFVHNITLIKSCEWKKLENEYERMIKTVQGNIVKLILETALLTDSEIEKCTIMAANCGMNVIKTSTGFGGRGANENDIKLIQGTLKKFFGNKTQTIGIKASGGIKSLVDAIKMVSLGATRIGTSCGVQIINSRNAI